MGVHAGFSASTLNAIIIMIIRENVERVIGEEET